ncbi:MAG: hypothetical protein WAO66_06630 [Bacteroidales bacterium]
MFKSKYFNFLLIIFLINNQIFSQDNLCVSYTIYHNNKPFKNIIFNNNNKPIIVNDLSLNIKEIYLYRDTLLIKSQIISNNDTISYEYFYNEKNKLEKIRSFNNANLYSVTFFNYYDSTFYEKIEYTNTQRYITRYYYDILGRLRELSYIELTDFSTNFSQRFVYDYDENGNICRKIQSSEYDTLCIWLYEYASDNILIKEVIKNKIDNNNALEKYYIYNNKDKLKQVLYIKDSFIFKKETYNYSLFKENLKNKKVIDYSTRPIKKEKCSYKIKKTPCNTD